ncbi:reverse transcriptase domain-containing protein [Tanacetum coccineum]
MSSQNKVTGPLKDVRRHLRMDYRTHDESFENNNDRRRSFQHRAHNKRAQTLGTIKAKEDKPGARMKRRNSHPSGGAGKGQHFVRSQVSDMGLKPYHREKGQSKLSVDFTDINKACPKEHHSLPMIEQKVKDLHQDRLKCFLDAYKRNNQIHIAEKDEEKIAFYTREGVFCYRRLPFSLKNAGVTYQRLIDKVFSHQLGRSMEVNAEDIVIKSNVEKEMLVDIKETLDGLRAINLKLNLKKCSFGIEEGVFSRHFITKQGIKASPSKVKAISDLQPPKSVNEIQNLNRKLTALNCFLSKGADKMLPFLRTLKSCISRKMVRWTTKADEAFQRIKELLEALPTIIAPIKGENLIMYLVASKEGISTVLMVLSDKPIKQILARPEKLGRIAKWAIELGEHEIEFRGRDSVKGKILADFLAETPSKKEEGTKDEEAKRKEPEP